MSKFNDNLTFSSEVTEVLVKQLFSFSKQWIKTVLSDVLRLKETMLMNKVEFLEKTVFFLVRTKT